MAQLEHAAFLIQQPVAPLAEAVDALVVKGGETRLGMIKVAADGLEGARWRLIRPGGDLLDERQVSAVLKEPHAPFFVDGRHQSSVQQPSRAVLDANFRRRRLRRQQAPVAQRHRGQRRGADTDAVGAQGLDPEGLLFPPPDQAGTLTGKS